MNIGSLTGSSSLMILFGRWSVIIWLIFPFFPLRSIQAARLGILGVDRFVESLVDGIENGLLCFGV